jgi:hypothetical protein
MTADQNQLDQAVAEGGAYEVIRSRLEQHATELKQKVERLNQSRIDEFGQAKLEVIGRVRVRTENNCVARDIVPVGDNLLFGYNVFIGLKKETTINDVFSLYQLSKNDTGFELVPQNLEGTFLDHPDFKKEFSELYVYYKEAKLIQLKIQNQILFAVFQIGRKIEDIRVFQWLIEKDGSAKYIDNRGERAVKSAPSHDFEWQSVTREQHESGSHPHINILDKVFVETVNGTLTIKVENNTEDGLGVYNEPVDDQTQSLADADIKYAEVGTLILLKILPYREKQSRFLVFNTRTMKVNRIDAIGLACVSLPEDHGIIFPGGYYLQNGETKSFPDQIEGLTFKRSIRSPNGEDVLYVFYEPESGLSGLFSYNTIRKELQNPIYANGFSVFNDGTTVIFKAEEEATRVHPMQIWETPYFSPEYAARQPTTDTFYSRIGNKELVRGISELMSINRAVKNPSPSRNLYEDLIRTSKTMFDSFFWLNEPEVDGLGDTLKQVTDTAELVIDEFEKVEQIRHQADKALAAAEAKQTKVVSSIAISDWDTPQQFVFCLTELREQRGHLITLRDQRYIDRDRIEELDKEVTRHFDEVSTETVLFLASDTALAPYHEKIKELEEQIENIELVIDIIPVNEELDQQSLGLDLLTEILNGLKVDDATVRTKILDDISEIYSRLNQVKAKGRQRKKQLGSGEASAEFAAQFRLFSQSINSALAMADSPEKADEQLSRLTIQLEELESKFSEFDQFLNDIMDKREELHSAFEGRRQSLLEEQQRRAQNTFSAAQRIIKGVNRRASSFADVDQLNTYFASDPMVMKISDLVTQLRQLNDQVRADDITSQLKAAKEQGIRGLRDKQDIFEDGGSVIKLGKHKFSVNTQTLDLTLLPRDDGLYRHLVGTDFFEKIDDPELQTLKPFWQQDLISENDHVSRIEYLAFAIISDAEKQLNGMSIGQLIESADSPSELTNIVRKYMSVRYQEGYEKGIHDSDTVKLLAALLPIYRKAKLLRYAPNCRSLAMLFWSFSGHDKTQQHLWQSHAISAQLLSKTFNTNNGFTELFDTLNDEIGEFCRQFDLPFSNNEVILAAEYLGQELASPKVIFSNSLSARELVTQFEKKLSDLGHERDFNSTMSQFSKLVESTPEKHSSHAGLKEQWSLSLAWLTALLKDTNVDTHPNVANVANVDTHQYSQKQHYLPEAAALIICGEKLPSQDSSVSLITQANDLLSEHKNITDGKIYIALDEFNHRLSSYVADGVSGFNRYHRLRQKVMQTSKLELQLDAYQAKPLSSFVRNRLIDEVYLPIIGDNLAKQMGTVGEDKRTDLMGLLLLISPPGYGKTTLMEYVADRLGLVFMKINCPSLGHDVTSLDPENAPNATARQELHKLNLGLEMGSNVMLYLDDIQHTHPEFLQKFIALCDGTRRIEGVWKGQSKTYDMRGKKFSVVMAGNPYTESGDVFTIPDMLANRADIYNLGDVLGGKEEQFSVSYIENSLTSNEVLAPLALRDMKDVHRFVAMAKGEQVPSTDLSHQYSGAELNEITCVLRHLLTIQEVILKVNLQYIESAATAEDYRREPPFKLQGSYRNMNKMAEKVSAIMNHDELMQLIGDHYIGEAQTLTSGAEENLLKLALLRDVATSEQKIRWEEICNTYVSKKSHQIEGDPTRQAVKQLSQMAGALEEIKLDMQQSDTSDLIKPINRVATAMHLLSKTWSGSEKSEKEN